MRASKPILAFLCAMGLQTVSLAGQPYLVSEIATGDIWRLEDMNDDGDALDTGERTLWATGFENAVGLETFGGAVYATNIKPPIGGDPQDEVIRLFDSNGDGDALDVGESVVWASGLNQPVDLVPNATGDFYVSQLLGNNVLHLKDSNGDGDALDVGEQTIYADGLNQPADLIAWNDGLLVSSFMDDDVFFLEDSNGDGDALDVAENTMVVADVGESFGLLADDSGGVYISSLFDNTIYRATDSNGDGDFLDVAEVLSYADNVFGSFNAPWDLAMYTDGGFLLANRSGGYVSLVRDLNGDGDALDLGDVTVFADGLAGGPIDIVALVESYNADFDGNSRVDGLDFLLWQQEGSPLPLSEFDLNLWEAQYGTTFSVAAAASVPEPSSLVLLAIGVCAAGRATLASASRPWHRDWA